MSSSERIATALFFVGVTVAICGGAKMPAEGSDWSDALPLFIGGAVFSAAALVWWRRIRAKELAEAPIDTAPDQDPFALLAALVPEAQELVTRTSELGTEQLQTEVDALLDRYVLPFAEVRQRVIDRLGMQSGAEVLVTLAYGERMLNRVWSAAADGHLPEAQSCVPEAVDALAEAHVIAQKALKSIS